MYSVILSFQPDRYRSLDALEEKSRALLGRRGVPDISDEDQDSQTLIRLVEVVGVPAAIDTQPSRTVGCEFLPAIFTSGWLTAGRFKFLFDKFLQLHEVLRLPAFHVAH